MLEIRNISKTYRAKSGVSVKALDRVSLTFAETGMVFLLGKSGSGKSTLLNVIGGLDTYDEGEIIIKGRTSRKFRGSDFDAYRNTFIGFIFQEYNILDEFSVGANIGLALELQGKKATSEAINAILEQVDLLDFASRKPNELSGGQKQRIAIARALIKDPQIIMADEPTGALDSAPGKQVLETLKKLSETKLVLVVSHDREFAEKYGDRIIELSDGRVISDMSLDSETLGGDAPIETEGDAEEAAPAGITIVDDSVIHISRGYTLTIEDMDLINTYLRKGDRDIVLSKDEGINEDVRQKKGIRASKKAGKGKARIFGRKPTGEVKTKAYNPADTRFIKSRLPLKNAVKIGTASMKAKPIRLIFTIFLSFIAFTMFGLADTMAAYNQYTAMADSLRDSNMESIAFSLYLKEEHSYKHNDEWVTEVYYRNREDTMNEDDLAALEEAIGIPFKGVYNGSYSSWEGMSISNMLRESSNLENDRGFTFFERKSIGGIVELTEEEAAAMGYTITGRFPQKANELVISQYTFQMMQLAGVRFPDGTEISSGNLNMEADNPNSILGKTITLARRDFTIVGVLDTGFDFQNEKYEAFHWDYNGVTDDNDMWQVQMALESELRYSYHTLAVCYTGVIDTLPRPQGGGYREYGASFYGDRSPFLVISYDGEFKTQRHNCYYFVGAVEGEQFTILYLTDGKTSLGAGEILLPIDFCFNYRASELGYTLDNQLLPDILKGVIEENSYIMSDWLDMTVYNEYVASCKGETPLSYEAYKAEIAKFFNAFYDLDLSWEMWDYSHYIAGHILGNTPHMNMDEYAMNRVAWSFILENWETVEKEYKDPDSGFGGYLHSIGFEESQLATLTDTEAKATLLCYATRYMREYSYIHVFGSPLTPSAMAEKEVEVCKQKYASRLNHLYGVDFSYDTWMGLTNHYGSSYLNGNLHYLTISEFVKEKELFDFISALDINQIITEGNTKGSAFNRYISSQDLGDKFGDTSKYDDAYQEGMWRALALHFADQCYYDEKQAFGLDVRTHVDQKSGEYAVEGMKKVSLPEIYLGFDVYGSDGSSREEIDYASRHTIAGFFIPDNDQQRYCVISDDLYNKAVASQSENDYRTVYGKHASGRYVMALAILPRDNRAALDAMTTLHHRAEGEFEFRMQNNVASVIDDWGETILMFNKIFFYVGIGFAVFASLMMLNFISVSVTHKKKEIGILRALGARSSDVFSIFFSEAFFVALINFALASVAVFLASTFINSAIRTELGFPITLLHFGIRQILLVFGVSVLVAFIGSFFPVNKIARKNPIDAMRDR